MYFTSSKYKINLKFKKHSYLLPVKQRDVNDKISGRRGFQLTNGAASRRALTTRTNYK